MQSGLLMSWGCKLKDLHINMLADYAGASGMKKKNIRLQICYLRVEWYERFCAFVQRFMCAAARGWRMFVRIAFY